MDNIKEFYNFKPGGGGIIKGWFCGGGIMCGGGIFIFWCPEYSPGKGGKDCIHEWWPGNGGLFNSNK